MSLGLMYAQTCRNCHHVISERHHVINKFIHKIGVVIKAKHCNRHTHTYHKMSHVPTKRACTQETTIFLHLHISSGPLLIKASGGVTFFRALSRVLNAIIDKNVQAMPNLASAGGKDECHSIKERTCDTPGLDIVYCAQHKVTQGRFLSAQLVNEERFHPSHSRPCSGRQNIPCSVSYGGTWVQINFAVTFQ